MTEYSIDGEGAISSVLSGTEFHGFDAGGSGRTKKVTAAQIATYVSANLTQSVAATVTAGTTRTQAGATALTKEINMVTTSTAPSAGSLLGDGVALMTAAAGLETIIINNTANVIQVYGVNGGTDTINGVAGSTGVAIPPNSVEIFFAVATGAWSYDSGVGSSGQLPIVLALSAITAGTTRTQGRHRAHCRLQSRRYLDRALGWLDPRRWRQAAGLGCRYGHHHRQQHGKPDPGLWGGLRYHQRRRRRHRRCADGEFDRALCLLGRRRLADRGALYRLLLGLADHVRPGRHDRPCMRAAARAQPPRSRP
jgi:hypothetical protein